MRWSPSYLVYRAMRGLARLILPRFSVEGAERLPEGPCVIVGNHAQMYGPVAAELYLPGDRAIWCNAQMMNLKEVPDYAYQDFWSRKPVAVRWLFRFASYLIAPLCVCVFNNAKCVAVYHDLRIANTFRETTRRLCEGQRIVIFPEHDVPHNHILYDFQDRFIDLGRMYRSRTGERLCFVPMYVAPELKKVILGVPVYGEAGGDPGAERRRVKRTLMDAITDLADAQPRHRVVPYRNMSRRSYPYNHPKEVGTR